MFRAWCSPSARLSWHTHKCLCSALVSSGKATPSSPCSPSGTASLRRLTNYNVEKRHACHGPTLHFTRVCWAQLPGLRLTWTCWSGESRWRYIFRSVMQQGLSPNFPKNCTMSSKGSPVQKQTHSRRISIKAGWNPRAGRRRLFLLQAVLPSRLSSGQPLSLSRCINSSRAKKGPLSERDSLPSSPLILSSTNLTTSATVWCTGPSIQLTDRQT